MKCLVFGHTGWIGSQVVELLKKQGCELILSSARLDNYVDVVSEFEKADGITHCLLAAGLTGRPNVDWCQDNKEQTLRVNVIGASIIGDLCYRKNIHLTYLGSGCIYLYNENHPIGGPGFTEEDEPNFEGSFYSHTKVLIEKILKVYDKTSLILRIRMPLSDDLHPKNFITKITRYQKVVNIPNSMTTLTDMLPLIPNMMTKKLTGIFNFTNPGVISHNQILDLYKEYIDCNFKYTNFSIDEHDKILKAKRSNNCLDCTKLLSYYPNIPSIDVAIVDLFKRMQKNLNIQH